MIGQTAGHYRIVERLGEGGMGEVYRGIDEMLDREVALKMLRPELAHRADVVDRFRAEAVTLARLDHPNIAHLYGMVQAGAHRIMVMEFVPGETLAARVEGAGRLPWRAAVDAVLQLLDGLDYAHGRDVIHRDIKPANLIVRADGRVKITDFGIARVLGTSRATRTGFMVGTLEYMAPEQIRGEDAGVGTDLYAAGIVLYQLLTGRVPFSATTEFELMRLQLEGAVPSVLPLAADVPEWLDDVIRRALAKDPGARMTSASAFREELAARTAAEAETDGIKPTRLAQTPTAPTRNIAGPTRVAHDAPPAGRAAAPANRHRVFAVAAAVVVTAALSSPWVYRALRPRAEAAPPAPVEKLSSPIEAAPEAPVSIPSAPRQGPVEPALPAPKARGGAPATPPAAPIEAPPLDIPPSAPPEVRIPAPTHAAAPRRVTTLPDAVFEHESLVVIEGSKTRQRDIVLRFSGDEIRLLDRKTRARIGTVSLARVESATYSRSKQPRWKTASAGVVLGGVFAAPLFFLKGTQHWLTLEGSAAPVVIRLDKDSWEGVLAEIEQRSSIKVTKLPASTP